MRPFVSWFRFAQQSVFQVLLHCSVYQYCMPSYSWMIFHSVNVPQVASSLFHLMGVWAVASFCLIWRVLLWTHVSMYLFLRWSTCFYFFGCILRSGVARSYSNSVFNFLRNCQSMPQQQYHFIFLPAVPEGSNSSASLPTLVIFLFWKKIIANLVGVKWYLTVILVCISLMISALEHLFIC